MRLITHNYVDISELTDTSGSGTENNLKTYDRETVFTSDTGIGGVFDLKIEMGSQAPVTGVVLGRHNFREGQDIRIYMYSGVFTTEVHDSGPMTVSAKEAGSTKLTWGEFGPWGTELWGADPLRETLANYVYWVPEADQVNTQAVKSIKITITAPTYEVEIGRLMIGEYIEPTYTLSYGHNLTWTESTKQFSKAGNTLRSNNKILGKKIDFELKTINAADRVIIQDALKLVGTRKDLFISLFPEDIGNKLKDYSGIMKLTKIPDIQEFISTYYKSKYIMEEA